MAVQTHEATREREINEARASLEKLRADRANIDAQIESKELLIEAWTNFELTLQGKFKAPTATQAPRKARAPSTGRAPRGTGGDLQKRILAVIEHYPDGATAEIINSELEATDAEAKKPIAAALFRMKKTNALRQPKPRGPYLIPTPTREAFEPPAGE
jgi:hypothetical protein